MNPSRRDRWPDFDPVRLVLIRRGHQFEQPWQGLLIDWRKDSSTRWSGLVVFVDERAEGRPAVQRWFDGAVLSPVKVDPNTVGVSRRD
jgi:hypothetical protein